MNIVRMLLNAAEQKGIDISADNNLVLDSSDPINMSTRFCDVCTRYFGRANLRFSCRICNSGDFDICMECHDTFGARCLDQSHILVQEIVA